MVSTFSHHATMINNKVRSLFCLNFFLTLSIFSLFLGEQADAQFAAPSGYNLVGTIQSQDFTGAVVIVTKGEQSFFRLFDELPDGSQIVAVRADSISLKRADGSTCDLYIAHEVVSSAQTAQTVQRAIPSDPYAGGQKIEHDPPNELVQRFKLRRKSAAS